MNDFNADKEKFTFTLMTSEGMFKEVQTVMAHNEDEAMRLLRLGGFLDDGERVYPGELD